MENSLADLLDLFDETLAKVTLASFNVNRLSNETFEALIRIGELDHALSLTEKIKWKDRQDELSVIIEELIQPNNQPAKKATVTDSTNTENDLTAELAKVRLLDSRTGQVDKFCQIACNLTQQGLVEKAKEILLEEALPIAFNHDYLHRRNILLSEIANELARLGDTKLSWHILRELIADVAKPSYNEWYFSALSAIVVSSTKAGKIAEALEIIVPLKKINPPSLSYAKNVSAVATLLEIENYQPETVANLQNKLDNLLQEALATPHKSNYHGSEAEDKYLGVISAIASGMALVGQAEQASYFLKKKIRGENKAARLVLELCFVGENLILAGFLSEANQVFDELIRIIQAEGLQIVNTKQDWLTMRQNVAAVRQSLLVGIASQRPVEQLLQIARQIEQPYYRLRALRVLAGYLAEQNQVESANKFFEEARTILETLWNDFREHRIEVYEFSEGKDPLRAESAIKRGGLARTWEDGWDSGSVYSEYRLYRTEVLGHSLAGIRRQIAEMSVAEAVKYLIEVSSEKFSAANSWQELYEAILLTQPLIEKEPEFGWQLYQKFDYVTKMPPEYLLKLLNWPDLSEV